MIERTTDAREARVDITVSTVMTLVKYAKSYVYLSI